MKQGSDYLINIFLSAKPATWRHINDESMSMIKRWYDGMRGNNEGIMLLIKYVFVFSICKYELLSDAQLVGPQQYCLVLMD